MSNDDINWCISQEKPPTHDSFPPEQADKMQNVSQELSASWIFRLKGFEYLL